ncbi:uncharacterized protein PG986_013290 [Apiospora aurea]|uniref:Uncharacterized protein n=1 Tax=Apiospora aurea TaxID=335848 RepID=A0ABR1PV59_9PEZI
MAPIPVYTNSPVATKPDGVTPQTAAPDASGSKKRLSRQPRRRPKRHTPRHNREQLRLFQSRPRHPKRKHHLCRLHPLSRWEPKVLRLLSLAGEKYVPPPPPTTSQAASAPYPQQMAIPPPTMAYPAQQLGTATAPAPSSAYAQAPTGIVGQDGAQNSLDHPPGYHQNVNAVGLDQYQYQRQAIARNESADRRQQDGTEEEGVWGAAKKWAAGAGEKLAAAESEVWKRINKD